ncbi:MAG: sensor histidine kinase [Gemmatimonadaceae bacterium]
MPNPHTTPRNPPSLRTELLASLAVLAVVAFSLAVASVLFVTAVVEDPTSAAIWLMVLVGVDVLVLVGFTASMMRRHVTAPLDEVVRTAEAISAGDLRRRAEGAGSQEFHTLASSMNRMTDRLLEERAQLVRAEKLAGIGRLAAGIAHEVGNPLGAIHGYAHLLKRELPDRPEAREALAGLERESERIDRIVRSLLDYARDRRLSPVAADAGTVLAGACELLRAQGVLRRIEVHVEGDTAPARVVCDRHDLEQLFVNLLLNAADAMNFEGRITVRVEQLDREALRGAGAGLGRPARAAARRRDDPPGSGPWERGAGSREERWLEAQPAGAQVVQVILADSGPGVPPELRERIFDPFFTTKESGCGTGLGLAIVARIVENCGGTIGVRAAREGGAAFHLLLPAAPSDAVAGSLAIPNGPA